MKHNLSTSRMVAWLAVTEQDQILSSRTKRFLQTEGGREPCRDRGELGGSLVTMATSNPPLWGIFLHQSEISLGEENFTVLSSASHAKGDFCWPLSFKSLKSYPFFTHRVVAIALHWLQKTEKYCTIFGKNHILHFFFTFRFESNKITVKLKSSFFTVYM